MQRLSREERRLQYLDAAVAIITESVASDENHSGLALAHVKIDDVAERAGVTKGAIYHIWPTQEAYWADLLLAMLDETTAAGDMFATWARQVTAPDYDGPEPTHLDVCRIGFESRLGNPAAYVRASLLSYASDNRTSDHLEQEAQDVAEIYPSATESILSNAGRHLRPGLSYSHVIAYLDAILNGLTIIQQYYPDLLGPLLLPNGSSIDAYSMVSEAAMLAFSEPDAPVDTGTIPIGSILGIPLDGPTLESIRNHANYGDNSTDDSEAKDRIAHYIQCGLELLAETGPVKVAKGAVDALGNVRISEVAERVGVSKGSIYHIWPSQELFRLDVLKHVLDNWSEMGARLLTELLTESAEQGWPPEKLLRVASDLAFDTDKATPQFLARFSFALYTANPEVAQAFREGNRKVNQRFGQVLERVITQRNRRLREPVTIDILVGYAEAVLYGLCLLYGTSPDLVDGHRANAAAEPGQPSRFTEIVAGLVEHLSEPIPG